MNTAACGRRIALSLAAIAALAGPHHSLAEPPDEAQESRYEFTTDWVSQDADVWFEHLKDLKGKRGVRGLEIGSFEGRSAIWFLDHILTDDSARITCIDLFPEAEFEERFDRNIEASGRAEKVEKLKGYSQVVLRGLPLASYDFVYIDGCHRATCVLSDAVLSFELLKPGGILIFDDYLWGYKWKLSRHEVPKLAIDAFLDVYGEDIEVLHKRGSVVVVRRKPTSTHERGGLLGMRRPGLLPGTPSETRQAPDRPTLAKLAQPHRSQQ